MSDNENDELFDVEVSEDDIAEIDSYVERLARGERLGGDSPEHAQSVQRTWDLVTQRLGLERSDVWTGAPLPPRRVSEKIRTWGITELGFARAGSISMVLVCGAAVWVGGGVVSRGVQTVWPRRRELAAVVKPYDPSAMSVHTPALVNVPAVKVPPAGGVGGSRLLAYTEGGRAFVAPGGDFTVRPVPGNPLKVYAGVLRGQARFELTKASGMLRVQTPGASAILVPPGKYLVRADSAETLVTVISGEAQVYAVRAGTGPNQMTESGESVSMRPGMRVPRFVSTVDR